MMIKSFTIVVFINLFLLTSLYANFNSKIIVKVENEIITNYELKNKNFNNSCFIKSGNKSTKN